MSIFYKFISLVLSSIAALTMQGPVTFSPVDKATIKLNFSIIADTHIDNIFNGTRIPTLVKGLKDMAKAEIKSDALIIAGDMTEGGTFIEWEKLGLALRTFCKADNILPEMGNHDIMGIKNLNGTSLMPYQFNAGKYFNLVEKTSGTAIEKVYFYRVIKGCYFIVLNPEGMAGMDTVLSAEQLQWLDGLLTAAAAVGNPVFIVNHQPMEAVGKDSAALNAILQKYNGMLDIFFITGHFHDGFNPNSITNDGTIYFVDTPCFGKSQSFGYNQIGTGFQAELYENQIIFRARNFVSGEWVPEFDRTIGLISD